MLTMRDPLADAVLTAWLRIPVRDRLMLATEQPDLYVALQTLAAGSRFSLD